MKNKKTILTAGIVGLIVALYISIPATFLVLMLGILFVPPLAALVSTIKEGLSVVSKEFPESESKSPEVSV